MDIPFVDLKAQYNSIKEEIKKEMDGVLENTKFVLGPKVENFEAGFADYCNKKYAVCANSGTAALHLALVAKGIGQGDEVITVPNTFIATAEAISYTGAKPVFVDIDESTYNIDPTKIEGTITKKTKAILPVHLYGQPADMDAVIKIAEQYNLAIIEDACQAHGAEYKGKKVPFSETGCFSFYPGKNLGAYGEGGAVVTDSDQIAEKVRSLRDHGQKQKHFHQYIGYNYRMSGFQGAVLSVKLKYLDKWIDARKEKAKLYNELLRGVVGTPKEAEYAKHVYHLYVIRTTERKKLTEYLRSKNISTGIHYPIPIHLQEAYSFMGLKRGSFPKAEMVSDEILSLPIYPEISEEHIRYICSNMKEFLK